MIATQTTLIANTATTTNTMDTHHPAHHHHHTANYNNNATAMRYNGNGNTLTGPHPSMMDPHQHQLTHQQHQQQQFTTYESTQAQPLQHQQLQQDMIHAPTQAPPMPRPYQQQQRQLVSGASAPLMQSNQHQQARHHHQQQTPQMQTYIQNQHQNPIVPQQTQAQHHHHHHHQSALPQHPPPLPPTHHMVPTNQQQDILYQSQQRYNSGEPMRQQRQQQRLAATAAPPPPQQQMMQQQQPQQHIASRPPMHPMTSQQTNIPPQQHQIVSHHHNQNTVAVASPMMPATAMRPKVPMPPVVSSNNMNGVPTRQQHKPQAAAPMLQQAQRLSYQQQQQHGSQTINSSAPNGVGGGSFMHRAAPLGNAHSGQQPVRHPMVPNPHHSQAHHHHNREVSPPPPLPVSGTHHSHHRQPVMHMEQQQPQQHNVRVPNPTMPTMRAGGAELMQQFAPMGPSATSSDFVDAAVPMDPQYNHPPPEVRYPDTQQQQQQQRTIAPQPSGNYYHVAATNNGAPATLRQPPADTNGPMAYQQQSSMMQQQQPQQHPTRPRSHHEQQQQSRINQYQHQSIDQHQAPLPSQHQQQQPHPTTTPHLLGNPTPPLTPNSHHLMSSNGASSRLAAAAAPPPSTLVRTTMAPMSSSSASNPSEPIHWQPANEQLNPPNNGADMPTLDGRPPNRFHQQARSSFNGGHNPNNGPAQMHMQPKTSDEYPHLSVADQIEHQHQQIQPPRGPMTSAQSTAGSILGSHQRQQPTMVRLTLPLRDLPVLGPFKLDHDAHHTTKVFHIKSQLFETLKKSINVLNPQTAAVIQELQFRAYTSPGQKHTSTSDSLLAQNQADPHQSKSTAANNACNWPESFQVLVNQNIVHLDRSISNHSNNKSHNPVNIFQYCQMGDNTLELQVNDCYCTHEFVIEAVDRPTLKAFMNSCLKSRLMKVDDCLQKLNCTFGSPGFIIQPQPQHQQQHHTKIPMIFNEYITDYTPNGIEQIKARISLKCPISLKRMRTPTRGHNCKHLQCFDLENFLQLNRDRTQWTCPLCSQSIAFNLLELDQHLMNIVQAMADLLDTDEILIDSNGDWHAYQPAHHSSNIAPQPPNSLPIAPRPVALHHNHRQSDVMHHPPASPSSKHPPSHSTYHPQCVYPPDSVASGSPYQQPMQQQQQHSPKRPMSSFSPARVPSSGPPPNQNHNCSPGATWVEHEQQPHVYSTSTSGAIRRSVSTLNGQSAPLNRPPSTKKPYLGPQSTSQPISAPQPTSAIDNIDELSPLAAMERTIIQHEQQMGPPPFDPNNLSLSSSLSRSSANGQQQQLASQQTTGDVGAVHQVDSGANIQHQAPPSAQQTCYSPGSRVASPVRSNRVGSPHQQPQRSPLAQATTPRAASYASAGIVTGASPISRSPMTASQQQQTTNVQPLSMPATPSGTILAHGAPDTPATPGNPGPHQQQSHLVATGSTPSHQVNTCATSNGGVDHQPLSNGSASAGSITSSSTMTPGGQSLGSVGMGGDSRCNTAPLQINGPHGLEDLLHTGGSSSANTSVNNNNTQIYHTSVNNTDCLRQQHGANGTQSMSEKNEILMSKLMMDSGEVSLLHEDGDLAMALENDDDWKQQLDKGKSEHLANFLNEPMMTQKHQGSSQPMPGDNNHNNKSSQQVPQTGAIEHNGDKMLSGGLNPSEDEDNNQSSHESSLDHHNHNNTDQPDFVNYLDSDAVDIGAGLPPDDSILDLFER